MDSSDQCRLNTYCLALAALLFVSPGCAMAADQKTGWKTECVGYYQFDLPGAVEAALVKPREFAWDMPNSKLQIKTPGNFSYILTDTPIWIGENVPREIMPHTDWRIVMAGSLDEALYARTGILAEGQTDASGRMSPTQKEEMHLQAAYHLTPWRLWLVYKRQAKQLLCNNNPPQKNENQAELQEYCQPLKKANPLRFADGSQPRYSVRANDADYPRLKTLVGSDESVYQITPPEAHEVFEWLRKNPRWNTTLTLAENTLVSVNEDSAEIYVLRAGRIYKNNIHRSPAGSWNSSNTDKKPSPSAALLATQFLKNFRVRAPFEVPRESGVCIPHGFIADDGKTQRRMSVTYRLKDHPEVELFFMEEKTPGEGSGAERGIRAFWDSLYKTEAKAEATYDIRNKFELPRVTNVSGDELDIREIEAIQIAGRNGKALFKKMLDLKDSKAYAYIAYASGYGLAAREMPTLMFYLISGDEPATANRLSKKEVLALAQRIVASIKRRVPD